MNTLVIYSSKTGNTQMIAKKIFDSIVRYEAATLCTVEDVLENVAMVNDYEKIAVGYWNDKGTADALTLKLVEFISDKSLILFGTQGACPDSEHGQKCIENVNALFNKNKILDHFLCQGKIDEKLTKMFENLPEDHPHYMDESRRKRHQEAALHPNSQDLEKAVLMIEKLYESEGK